MRRAERWTLKIVAMFEGAFLDSGLTQIRDVKIDAHSRHRSILINLMKAVQMNETPKIFFTPKFKLDDIAV